MSKYVRLGDYIKQIRGVSYKPTDLHNNLNASSVILLRANNINNGEINFEDIVYVDKSKVKEEQYLKKGDILVCASSGSKELVGKAAFVRQDFVATFGAFCKLIRPVNCLAGFLGHYFNSDDYRNKISSLALGANINNIRNEHINDIKIFFPDKISQKNISLILDKVTDLIDKHKRQLEKLDELVKARFVEMFGGIHDSILYPYSTIDSFTSVMSGGTPDRKTTEYWQGGNIRWVKTTELQNCIINDTEEKITQAGADNSSVKLMPANSILVAMYGQGKTRGMTGYLEVECTTNQACACILPSSSINQKYLWQYMILSYNKLRDMAKGGNQPNLNTGIIKKFPVLIPPIELQNQFADFVKQVEKIKTEVKKSLEKIETLKKSLMQKYFG